MLILLNICATSFVLMAIPMATTTTGRPVPIPQIAGINSLDCSLMASGITLPKNSTANTGQKVRAKREPRIRAPSRPLLLIFS
ncbi:hypothetical protein V513_14240 [Mesotoga sp. H07.pep.5.3]|nr:hypothetical protein V513_14240 [Mesotoga sp. H07.pep.5.3]